MTTKNVLLASVFLSLKSVIGLLVATIETDKVYLPFKAKVGLYLWSAAACSRRILSMFMFFVPAFGLFNILSHWKAEQIPFALRIQIADSVKGLFSSVFPSNT